MKATVLINDNGETLEIKEQYQDGEIILAEAQISLQTGVIENTMTFYIEDVDEMNFIINRLTDIRDKMISHYQANPENN